MKIKIETLELENIFPASFIDKIQANYVYNNQDTLKSIWKVHYVITNIGQVAIVGEGNSKNIIDANKIHFFLDNSDFKILNIEILNYSEAIGKVDFYENSFEISAIKQWKKNEKIDLMVWMGGAYQAIEPQLIYSDHQTLEDQIVYQLSYKQK